MRASFKCDCSGHELRLKYDKDGMLFILIRDRNLNKTKFKVKGYLGDVVLFDRPKSKVLSDFKKFVKKLESPNEKSGLLKEEGGKE